MQKNLWEYGNYYAKTQQYLDNPKYVWTVLAKLIQKYKKNKKLFWDIGCADASMLRYLELIFPNWKFQGTDNNKFLLKHAKKNTKKTNIFLEDLNHKLKKNIEKADIIYCGGVNAIYDDMNFFLSQVINRGNKKSDIFVHGIFNPNPIDMVVRFRNCTKKNFLKDKIDLIGWNRFSMKTMSAILKKNKKVKSHKFITIDFPKNLKVKRKKNEPEKSWSIIHKNRLYFVNGTNIIEEYQMLHIKLK